MIKKYYKIRKILIFLLIILFLSLMSYNYVNNITENMIDEKKIALIFFGISYNDDINTLDWNVDFRESYENYNDKILNYFKNKGYNTDIYASTNVIPSDIKEEMNKLYNPLKIIETENNIQNKFLSRHQKFIKGIESVLNSNINYEFVILLRYDLTIHDNFDNIDINKINIVSKLEKEHLIDDNIYIIPYSKLNKLYNVLNENAVKYNYDYHYIKNELLKVTNIHYIKNEENPDGVGGLSFFTINRNKNRYFRYKKKTNI